MKPHGALNQVDAVAVLGVPLDQHHWRIQEWPSRIAAIGVVVGEPAWVTEVGVSMKFRAEHW